MPDFAAVYHTRLFIRLLCNWFVQILHELKNNQLVVTIGPGLGLVTGFKYFVYL